MAVELTSEQKWSGALAVGVGAVSGIVSSYTLEPVLAVLERMSWFDDTLVGVLSPLAMSAGLSFGLIGAAFGLTRLGFRWPVAGLWLIASIVGMGAAFYVAMLTYDSSNDGNVHYIVPYLCASPVGALILGGPMVLFRPYIAKWKLLAMGVGPPTLWAFGIALVMAWLGSDDALTPQWLLPLYVGWQVLFLVPFAMWPRA